MTTCSATPLGLEPLTFAVGIKSAATQAAGGGACTQPTTSPGFFNVTVTTPKGVITRGTISVAN